MYVAWAPNVSRKISCTANLPREHARLDVHSSASRTYANVTCRHARSMWTAGKTWPTNAPNGGLQSRSAARQPNKRGPFDSTKRGSAKRLLQTSPPNLPSHATGVDDNVVLALGFTATKESAVFKAFKLFKVFKPPKLIHCLQGRRRPTTISDLN